MLNIDAIHPDAEGFARYATCDAFVGSSSPVMGVKPLGPGEAFNGRRKPNNTWEISVSQGSSARSDVLGSRVPRMLGSTSIS